MSNARSTKTQRLAAAAFREVHGKSDSEQRSFARSFPSLIHTSGLCQAVAYARTKGPNGPTYLESLSRVLRELGHAGCDDRERLAMTVHELPTIDYVRLSRDALEVANYLKRFHDAEAMEARLQSDGGGS